MGSKLFLLFISAVFGAGAIYLTWLVWRDVKSGHTSIRERGQPKRVYFREDSPIWFWLVIGGYILAILLLLVAAFVFLQFLWVD